jgi:hypothetical protein
MKYRLFSKLYGVILRDRSQTSRSQGGGIIATAAVHFEHISCAVKSYAYGLDSSIIYASALQQKLPFPQAW